MKAPKCKWWTDQMWKPPFRANRLLFLVVAIVALVATDFAVNASEKLRENSSGQASANPGELETSLAGPAEDALGDYRLSPGDNLKIVVLDQPELSGDFIVDGGGGILLPLAGNVSLEGLTLAEAQQLIQEKFADGVLVKPAVSVRMTSYRQIFVTGRVRRPGGYSFVLGESVKAAIAAAGGEGQRLDQAVSAADLITAAQRVRQLEADQATLLMRKARLKAQRDGRKNFIMPLLVGLNGRNVDFNRAYSAESDTFLGLAETYRRQIEALEAQRPRIEAEANAVTDQIAKQKERLGIVNSHLADLKSLFDKGLLRKEVLLNQQIEKALVEAQLSNLEAQVAHQRQTMGELDVKLSDLKAGFERQTLVELQQTSQHLLETENSIGPARKILEVKAEAASDDGDQPTYAIFISRVRDGRMITFETTDEAILSPGDVVEVKLKRRDLGDESSPSTEAVRILDGTSVAEGSQP
jgi:polysaccharide biosynthesis/export protein